MGPAQSGSMAAPSTTIEPSTFTSDTPSFNRDTFCSSREAPGMERGSFTYVRDAFWTERDAFCGERDSRSNASLALSFAGVSPGIARAASNAKDEGFCETAGALCIARAA